MDFAKDKIITANIGRDTLKLKCIESLGSGGQGDVWKVEELSSHQIYALKVINEQNAEVKLNKIYNIRSLVNGKVDERLEANGKKFGINHVFPLQYFSIGDETFYLMECVKGKTLNSLLLKGLVESMPLKKKYLICYKIAKSVDMLHSIGRCYTDISWGNFMWDDKEQVVSVIDCENVTNSADIDSGRCAFLYGTAFFIAPEVAARKSRAKFNSDKFAFASLCFRFIMNNYIASAYHGKAMAEAIPAPGDMFEVIEFEEEDDLPKEWRYFIFDENHRDNNITDVCKNPKNPENIAYRKRLDYVEKTWKQLPDNLKAMFQRAFKDPFNDANRPSLSEWARVLRDLSEDKVAPSPIPQKQVQTQNQNVNPAPVINNPAPQKSAFKNPYKTFNPQGVKVETPKVDDLTTVPPHSLKCEDKIVSINKDPFIVEGDALGLKVKELGTINKVGNEYQFVSNLLGYIEVYNENNKLVVQLKKGEQVILKNKYYLKPLVLSKKIYIIY